VFADPQRLNPGNITIVREIITPPTPPADCNGKLPVFGATATGVLSFVDALGQPAVAPLNCDVAVFNNPRAEYQITALANGNVIVDHVVAKAKNLKSPAYEGIDTLRNIELIMFSDVTIPAPKFTDRIVPNVIGMTPAAATAALAAVGLTVGATTNGKANVTNPVPIGNILTQSPTAGTIITVGGAVNLVISTGIPVPNVVGLNYPGQLINGAVHSITEAGMVVGTITTQLSATVPAGVVISQDPAAEVGANFGTAVNLVVSAGGVTVPSVVGTTQASATSAISAVNLPINVTFQASATIPSGTVISQNPAGGTLVAPGTPVAIVVSSGSAPTITATVRTVRQAGAAGATITSPSVTPVAGTLLVALVSADAPDPCCAPNTLVTGVTGGGLTWTRAVRSNVQLGTAEIWWASSPAAHAAMTVSATMNNIGQAASLTVMTFTGAASSLVGAASGAFNAASGAPLGTVVTTRPNSMVLAVGTDWDAPRTMIAGTGQVIVNQFNPTVGDTYWVQRSGIVGTANTSVSINDSYTTPLVDRWNLALVEIRQP